MKGTIKFYKKEKGFGFIIGEDGKEYFLHVGQLEVKLDQVPFTGDHVTFEPKKTIKGLQARECVLE